MRAGVASCAGRQSCRTRDPAFRPGSHSQRLQAASPRRAFHGDADGQPIHRRHSTSLTHDCDWHWRPEVLQPRSNNTCFLVNLRRRLPLGNLKNKIALYTLWGYISLMRPDIKTACSKRLNRIEGQVRGLSRMVEEDRYCIDIVTQIAAVRAALRRVEEEILRDHVAHCVEHAIASGDKADQRRKIEELMTVIGRAER